MERIRSIVVPTDFSPLSNAAAERAATLARLEGASIHLVHVVSLPLVATPYGATIPATVWEQVREAARKQLEAARKEVEGKGVATVTAAIPDTSDAVEAIRSAAETHEADLVVMGTHGHGGLTQAFLGSVAARTIRTLDRPVLAVKEDVAKAAQPIGRILLAVDFSAHSDRAVSVAGALGKRLGASVDVVHALDLPHDYTPYASEPGTELEQKIQAAVAEKLEGVRAQLGEHGVEVTLHFRRGRPSLAVAEVAAELHADLIVMGTRGATGLDHVLLGSVAERTLRTAPCSVLVVKAG
ncbi:MAG: universal stress protein [Myxococcota bacterium]